MTGLFWALTAVMCVLAFAFIANPLREAGRKYLVVALGVIVPTAAASMYLVIGSPQLANAGSVGSAITMARSSSPSMSAKPPEKKVGSVSSMLEGLEQRLQDNPEDGKGWLLLAKSYKHINRLDESASAYTKAKALGEFDQSLESPAGDTSQPTISGAQIFGNLSLSAEAAELVEPTDTVFIFARAVAGAGVPAAVLQRPASDLPLDFLLNDTQSMMPEIKLSDFDEVIVTARISRSGNAMEALQGLEAKSGVVSVADNKHLNLVIE